MQVLVIIAIATLCLVWNVVGIKILLVARRSRGFGEFALGLSFFLCGGFGVPLSASVQVVPSVGVGGVISIVASIFNTAGITLLFAFTAHVFYRGQRWAQAVVAGMVVFGVYYVVGHGHARLSIETLEEIAVVQVAWAAHTIVPTLLAYAWAGFAAFRHYRQLRRRLAIGLADPVVVNRLLLWSLFSTVSVVTTVLAGVLMFSGSAFARDSIQPVTTALGGLTDSVILLLAFAPPKRYLDAVQRRADARAPV
ncbi:MAG: hypothetical protein MJE66_16135 [Proteobacteria bacterium]|nr:hypothetical protein [Pseudomonadota bacterium]